MSDRIVVLRPLLFEQGFGLAVAFLLAPVHRYRISPVMPVHRACVEADRSAALHQTPAQVDIVTRRAITWVETGDRNERASAERHVATGDVLRKRIAQQYVHRP